MCAIASVYSPIIEQHFRSSRDEPHRSWFEYFTHADELELEAGGVVGSGTGVSHNGANPTAPSGSISGNQFNGRGMSPGETANRRKGIFGTEQASIGRVLALFDLRTGKRVLDTIRSMICLIWYYVSPPLSCYFQSGDRYSPPGGSSECQPY